MNDKFLEILSKSSGRTITRPYDGSLLIKLDLTELEKFAELIVNEASKVCATKYWNDDVTSRNIGLMFAADIKKYFGL